MAAIVVSDLELDISVYYQEILDIKLDIKVINTAYHDFALDIFSAGQNYNDIFLDIYSATGLLYYDFAIDINITDGNTTNDLGLDLMTITKIQTFKAVYGIQLNSVLKDVTP